MSLDAIILGGILVICEIINRKHVRYLKERIEFRDETIESYKDMVDRGKAIIDKNQETIEIYKKANAALNGRAEFYKHKAADKPFIIEINSTEFNNN